MEIEIDQITSIDCDFPRESYRDLECVRQIWLHRDNGETVSLVLCGKTKEALLFRLDKTFDPD